MSYARKFVPFALLIVLLTWAFDASAQGSGQAGPPKIARWQSNLSIGAVVDHRMGIVKSFWWFPVPKILAMGMSLDYVMPAIPFSLNVSASAPVPIVTPFVCAGAGGTLTGGKISNYGGGVRIRLGPKFGLVCEYRRYHYSYHPEDIPDALEKDSANYFGAGISWLY